MDPRVEKTLEYIERHFHESIERTTLADIAGLSVSRFSHLFRRHTGKTPSGVIRAVRIQKAKELLSGSHLMIKEVAIKVGIVDQSHFVRDFQSVTGLSPVHWRQANCLERDQLASKARRRRSRKNPHDSPGPR